MEVMALAYRSEGFTLTSIVSILVQIRVGALLAASQPMLGATLRVGQIQWSTYSFCLISGIAISLKSLEEDCLAFSNTLRRPVV